MAAAAAAATAVITAVAVVAAVATTAVAVVVAAIVPIVTALVAAVAARTGAAAAVLLDADDGALPLVRAQLGVVQLLNLWRPNHTRESHVKRTRKRLNWQAALRARPWSSPSPP